MPDMVPVPVLRACAEAIAGRIAREVAKMRKRRIIGTWIPEPPGLSCEYIGKDALVDVSVSSRTSGGRLTVRDG
jgi:hypothetical protein